MNVGEETREKSLCMAAGCYEEAGGYKTAFVWKSEGLFRFDLEAVPVFTSLTPSNRAHNKSCIISSQLGVLVLFSCFDRLWSGQSLLATKKLKIGHQEKVPFPNNTKRAPLRLCFGFLTLPIFYYEFHILLLSNHLSRNFLLQFSLPPYITNQQHPSLPLIKFTPFLSQNNSCSVFLSS